jgi:hypothetical protein
VASRPQAIGGGLLHVARSQTREGADYSIGFYIICGHVPYLLFDDGTGD